MAWPYDMNRGPSGAAAPLLKIRQRYQQGPLPMPSGQSPEAGLYQNQLNDIMQTARASVGDGRVSQAQPLRHASALASSQMPFAGYARPRLAPQPMQGEPSTGIVKRFGTTTVHPMGPLIGLMPGDADQAERPQQPFNQDRANAIMAGLAKSGGNLEYTKDTSGQPVARLNYSQPGAAISPAMGGPLAAEQSQAAGGLSDRAKALMAGRADVRRGDIPRSAYEAMQRAADPAAVDAAAFGKSPNQMIADRAMEEGRLRRVRMGLEMPSESDIQTMLNRAAIGGNRNAAAMLGQQMASVGLGKLREAEAQKLLADAKAAGDRAGMLNDPNVIYRSAYQSAIEAGKSKDEAREIALGALETPGSQPQSTVTPMSAERAESMPSEEAKLESYLLNNPNASLADLSKATGIPEPELSLKIQEIAKPSMWDNPAIGWNAPLAPIAAIRRGLRAINPTIEAREKAIRAAGQRLTGKR